MIVIFGTGFLGYHFHRCFDNSIVYSRADYNNLNIDLLVKPTVIINALGLKDLSICENDSKTAIAANVVTTFKLLKLARYYDAHFIQISTDYVFYGDIGGYNEHHKPSPSTNYGLTKLYAELLCSTYNKCTIIRSGGIYGAVKCRLLDWAYGYLSNFKIIEAYTNVYYTPTYIDELIVAISRIINNHIFGTYHVSGPEITSRYEFLRAYAIAHGYDCDLVVKAAKPYDSFIPFNLSLVSDCYIERPSITVAKGLGLCASLYYQHRSIH